MDSNTKIAKSYVSHEEVQSAMEQFLARGGKITKVTPYFIIIQLLHNMSKILYPEYCYIFYHRDMRKTSNKLRYLLEGLNNKSIKITKKNLKIDNA